MTKISLLRDKEIVFMPEGVYSKLVKEGKSIKDLSTFSQHRFAIQTVTQTCKSLFTQGSMIKALPLKVVDINAGSNKPGLVNHYNEMLNVSVNEVEVKNSPFEIRAVYDTNLLDGLIIICPFNIIGVFKVGGDKLTEAQRLIRQVVGEGMDKYFGKEEVKTHLEHVIKNSVA